MSETRTLEALSLAAFMAPGAGRGRRVSTRDLSLNLDDLARATSLDADPASLERRSVALVVSDMAKAAAALIELDGLAGQILLCPPGVDAATLAALARVAEIDALVHDGDAPAPDVGVATRVVCRLPMTPLAAPRRRSFATEWILPTSGTSGTPKLVAHTLATLTAPFQPDAGQRWATFYDIRRYGGLQIFLRALAGVESLTLSDPNESVEAFLLRLATAGATLCSGTPSHWRKALMCPAIRRLSPQSVRLSGEIADDAMLAALKALFPAARVEHAYASTEAGVVFTVGDGRAGFPATLIGERSDMTIRIEDETLRVRSRCTALRSPCPARMRRN